jgi:hypothetical protein
MASPVSSERYLIPNALASAKLLRLCGVSHHSIEKLVEAGLLNREQVASRAPWLIRRADLRQIPSRAY